MLRPSFRLVPTIHLHFGHIRFTLLLPQTSPFLETLLQGISHALRHLLGVSGDEEGSVPLVDQLVDELVLLLDYVLHVNLVLLITAERVENLEVGMALLERFPLVSEVVVRLRPSATEKEDEVAF